MANGWYGMNSPWEGWAQSPGGIPTRGGGGFSIGGDLDPNWQPAPRQWDPLSGPGGIASFGPPSPFGGGGGQGPPNFTTPAPGGWGSQDPFWRTFAQTPPGQGGGWMPPPPRVGGGEGMPPPGYKSQYVPGTQLSPASHLGYSAGPVGRQHVMGGGSFWGPQNPFWHSFARRMQALHPYGWGHHGMGPHPMPWQGPPPPTPAAPQPFGPPVTIPGQDMPTPPNPAMGDRNQYQRFMGGGFGGFDALSGLSPAGSFGKGLQGNQRPQGPMTDARRR